MTGEIDGDFYCMTGKVLVCKLAAETDGEQWAPDLHCDGCPNRKRKWPTPEQFREEYGREAPGDMPAWVLYRIQSKIHIDGKSPDDIWEWYPAPMLRNVPDSGAMMRMNLYAVFSYYSLEGAVLGCTPWSKPPDGWRPK